ncbi:hypothetical protein KAJ89_03895 [Candidatus Parcubacteria bacterium]|nr:hypothetical protein [Candidatus Parcubacteria bacterium]
MNTNATELALFIELAKKEQSISMGSFDTFENSPKTSLNLLRLGARSLILYCKTNNKNYFKKEFIEVTKTYTDQGENIDFAFEDINEDTVKIIMTKSS